MFNRILRSCCALVLLMGCAGGCATFNPDDPQTIENLKLDVADAVGGVIIFSDNSGAEARRINKVAVQVKTMAQGAVDLSDLRKLMVQVIAGNAAGKDRDQAVFFTNLAINRLKRFVGLGTIELIPPEQFTQVRTVLIAICDGAIEASEPFIAVAMVMDAAEKVVRNHPEIYTPDDIERLQRMRESMKRDARALYVEVEAIQETVNHALAYRNRAGYCLLGCFVALSVAGLVRMYRWRRMAH